MYYDVASLARDQDFIFRVTAAYAQELTADDIIPVDPYSWAIQHQWAAASAPGFGDAYAFAVNSDPPNPAPGKDPSVITDGQILSVVQHIRNPNPPEVEPTEQP